MNEYWKLILDKKLFNSDNFKKGKNKIIEMKRKRINCIKLEKNMEPTSKPLEKIKEDK